MFEHEQKAPAPKENSNDPKLLRVLNALFLAVAVSAMGLTWMATIYGISHFYCHSPFHAWFLGIAGSWIYLLNEALGNVRTSGGNWWVLETLGGSAILTIVALWRCFKRHDLTPSAKQCWLWSMALGGLLLVPIPQLCYFGFWISGRDRINRLLVVLIIASVAISSFVDSNTHALNFLPFTVLFAVFLIRIICSKKSPDRIPVLHPESLMPTQLSAEPTTVISDLSEEIVVTASADELESDGVRLTIRAEIKEPG